MVCRRKGSEFVSNDESKRCKGSEFVSNDESKRCKEGVKKVGLGGAQAGFGAAAPI